MIINFSSFRRGEQEVGDAAGLNPTQLIGLSFISIAYFLHPAVELAYRKVRACIAWRAIEKNRQMEVTEYPFFEEVFRGRGKWDVARAVTVLLAAFSLASWGLEIRLGLAYHEGEADLLNRPPPVFEEGDGSNKIWQVNNWSEIESKKWTCEMPNSTIGSANSEYRMIKDEDRNTICGNIQAARWSTQPKDSPQLFYYKHNNANSPTAVKSLQCSPEDPQANTNTALLKVNGNIDDNLWGSVTACESGPELKHRSDIRSPPTIMLNRSSPGDEGYFVVVEESSGYPSFLYSVWTAVNSTSDAVELRHEYHIASTMRLAEAVVTGIAHGNITGGYCFGLLRHFSHRYHKYEGETEDDGGPKRAQPFGENPNGDIKYLEVLERIEAGVEIDLSALVSFAVLVLLTLVSVLGWLCLRSSVKMDVYNRDELLRAVCLQGEAMGGTPLSAMRVFVHKEATGEIRVAVNAAGDQKRGCPGFFGMRTQTVEQINPTPRVGTVVAQNNGNIGGDPLSMGPRTMWLEGMRTGMGRALPGREGNFLYPTSVSLTASANPSNAGSTVTTPEPYLSPSNNAQRNLTQLDERGGSVLFDSVFSLDSNDLEYDRGIQAAWEHVRGDATVEGGQLPTPGIGHAELVSSHSLHSRDGRSERRRDQ